MEPEIRAAMRHGVEIIDEVLKAYGVPYRAAEMLTQLRDFHLSLLEDDAPSGAYGTA